MSPADEGGRASAGAGVESRLEAVTAELLELYEEVNVLFSLAGIAARETDLAGAGRQILEEAVRLLDADVGFIHYTGEDLRSEEPEPVGLDEAACREIARMLDAVIPAGGGAVVVAPFYQAAAIPRAPESVAAARLAAEGETLGLIVLGRRAQGSYFTAGDEKILQVIAAQAALVTAQRRNLDLSRMARSLEERTKALRGVVEVGREITSTLDLDRVLRAVADLPARVLGFERCGVAVEHGTGFSLRALSNLRRIDRDDPSVASLEGLLAWVASRPLAFTAVLREGPDGRDELACEELGVGRSSPGAAEFAERARAHFEASGARAVLAIPLNDDQGALGAIGLESEDPDALTEAATEAALVLAHQATVAMRNGRLYRDLPFIKIIEPLQRGRSRLAAIPRRKLVGWAAAAAVVAIVSVLTPWDFRVPGTFTLHPGRRIQVVSQVEGVIRQVGAAREGDFVSEGQVLAWLDDTDWQLKLNDAEWRMESARRAAAEMEAAGRAADIQVRRLEAERWREERDLLRVKIEQSAIRAPASGVLMTAHLEEKTGELLSVGTPLCELADLGTLRAEIAIREADADALARPLPVPAVLKFQAFPDRDVAATVRAIRPAAEQSGGRTSLVAEAILDGPMQGLRPGMTGDARVEVGRRSVAALVLRSPYRFLLRRLWW